ncbi:AbiV family abortive infection protein [Pelagibius litoralis]|uniref:AbiV family abortive infection protein n=1 Tax=Pelagibius litoralis TaxID=374515 RepID=A0A967EXA9_9PROT|nr:AbiV family abortive infection protein [Pelagibius litoralis]NIA68600.1 AbiV family abortive infection protein [Pelagibius litoralis]
MVRKTAKKPPKKRAVQIGAKDRKAMRECIVHARNLLNSARAVQGEGHPNIAYHLAALALEEVGRWELIALKAMSEHEPVPSTWMQKHMGNHVKKLFWCFFGAEFYGNKLTKEGLESMEVFARQVHANRLIGLYVEQTDDGVSVPAEAIDAREADTLIELADVRLEMAEARKLRVRLTADEIELQAWFLEATGDLEKRRMIMSDASLTKLAELKNALAWINWLKEQFDQAEREGRVAAEEELKRARLGKKGTGKDKWRIRVRIFTQSHLIRPKALTAWNKSTEWIKLSAVSGKKDQLDIDITLADSVPPQGVWWLGWGIARHFVTALNIGTMGFWWWRMPKQIDRYYERIDNLERKMEVTIERSPSLRIDWGENRVLTEGDLYTVSQCFAAMPAPADRDQHTPFNYYIGGLTFLSLNDVHWQCEKEAFGNFMESLKQMLAGRGAWQRDTPITPRLMAFLDQMFPEFDEREQYREIFDAYERKAVESATVTLKEVSFMKLFCDAYFLKEVRPTALKSLAEERAESMKRKKKNRKN